MKPKYTMVYPGVWIWTFGPASGQTYTRRSDAVRGFERHCAAIRRVKA